jgi:hypothetical protein
MFTMRVAAPAGAAATAERIASAIKRRVRTDQA